VKAIDITQQGYFQVGAMTQGLGWERYPYPATLAPWSMATAHG
jgi:beta-lactamase class C